MPRSPRQVDDDTTIAEACVWTIAAPTCAPGAIGMTHHQMAVLLGEYLADDEALDEWTRLRIAAWVDQQRAELAIAD
jgi:hypothetical protein